MNEQFDELLAELWDAIMARAERLNVQPITYVWKTYLRKTGLEVDRVLYVNGTKKSQILADQCDLELKPFNAFLLWNGLPVGIFSPHRGEFMGAPAERWAEIVEAIRNG
jgi:hypothetical protein